MKMAEGVTTGGTATASAPATMDGAPAPPASSLKKSSERTYGEWNWAKSYDKWSRFVADEVGEEEVEKVRSAQCA